MNPMPSGYCRFMGIGGGRARGRRGAPRVAVMTMARDEAELLPRWVDYYARQVGADRLLVLDDGSTDGSTDSLPCSVYRLPDQGWRASWSRGRTQLVNGMAKGLLACHDAVIFADVDEFLVPDPAKYAGLLDYVARTADRPVSAGVGLNLLHHPGEEGALDPELPVLAQRRFVKYAPGMCKPLVKRVDKPWSPGFHGVRARFGVDPDLWLLHLKYADVGTVEKTAARRSEWFHHEGRGGLASAWRLGAPEAVERARRWVDVADPGSVPEAEFAPVDLEGVVKPVRNSFYRAKGNPIAAMDRNPLLQLPERFRTVF